MMTTLTPSPSLDRTVTLDGGLRRGGVNRLHSVRVDPGGKGINVARVLASSGLRAQAVFPCDPDDPLMRALAEAPGPAPVILPVTVGHSVRVNTTITEPDGTTTKLNEPGQPLSPTERETVEQALVAAVREAASEGPPSWAVLSGALPAGVPAHWYPRLVRLLHEAVPGLHVAVDTSQAPLAALAAALPEHAPELLTPNGEELGQLVGLSEATALEDGAARGQMGPVLQAAHVLVDKGVGAVMVTLGPCGAVLVTSQGAWHATAPTVEVVSTVGAGDSALAGYLLAQARGGHEEQCLAAATAYGSAAASLPGTTLPRPEDLPGQGVVTRLD